MVLPVPPRCQPGCTWQPHAPSVAHSQIWKASLELSSRSPSLALRQPVLTAMWAPRQLEFFQRQKRKLRVSPRGPRQICKLLHGAEMNISQSGRQEPLLSLLCKSGDLDRPCNRNYGCLQTNLSYDLELPIEHQKFKKQNYAVLLGLA